MPAGKDWGDLALTFNRDQFAARFRHPFLYSTQKLLQPERPQQTVKYDVTQLVKTIDPNRPEGEGGPLVFPILKVQQAFPSMITVGRTQNNDIIVDDVQVSKFHAFFRIDGARIQLVDAGSSNGTRLRGDKLAPRAAPAPVRSGDLVAFGPIEFLVLSSADCWNKLVADLDQWGD